MYDQSLKKDSGISLIELVIVVAIIGILSSVALPNFNEFRMRNKVKNTGRTIISTVQLARIQAISRNSTTTITLNPEERTYLFDNTVYNLPIFVHFGGGAASGNAINNDVAYEEDGVCFPNNTITLFPNGQANENGAIYLTTDDNNESYAIEIRTTGKVTLYRWDSGSWTR